MVGPIDAYERASVVYIGQGLMTSEQQKVWMYRYMPDRISATAVAV